MQVDPDRRDAVQVATSLRIFQVDAAAALDDEGRRALPVPLLREGMPEVAPVILLQPARANLGYHGVKIMGGTPIIGRERRIDNVMTSESILKSQEWCLHILSF